MHLKFKNLGAVKSANIDLSKKLIVFCGPNNTGKTYVSYAIYGIIEGLKNKFFPSEDFFSKKHFLELLDKKKVVLSLKLDYNTGLDRMKSEFKENMDSIYGISKSEVKRILNDTEVDFKDSPDEFYEKLVISKFNIVRDYNFIKLRLIKKAKSEELLVELVELKSAETDRFMSSIIGFKIFNFILRYPVFNAHIFSVERNSIYTFSKELSVKRNMLIDEMQKISDSKSINPFDWMSKRSTRYPLPIRDGLEIAEDIVNYQKTDSDFIDFATEIESEILKGKVSVNKDGEVVFASNKAKSKKIPIHLSASLVKTLSSVIFYLKHLAQQNDLIIIDEPELNLHPDNQIILTRIFAKLINKGFRLLISTHSDYVIREVNNLIMLSSVKDNKKLIDGLGYKKDECLNSSDVGAYLFKYPNSKSVKTIAEEIPISHDGFDIESIDETINGLNNRSMTLYQQLMDQKELELEKE